MILTKENIIQKYTYKIKRTFFKIITKNSPNMFFRPGDIITLSPIIKGEWEEETNAVLKQYSKEKFSDFLIDVGANIGLTSCQNKNLFKHYYCIEPNPLCYNILKVNLDININDLSYTAYNFGLGDIDSSNKLYIPKKNWGGAFIKENNPYKLNLLLKKENLKKIDIENFIFKNVKIKDGNIFFKNLFKGFKKRKFIKGIVKIDVEGFEKNILRYISKNIPNDFSIIIIFENWDKSLNFEYIKSLFTNHELNIKYIKKNYGIQNNYTVSDYNLKSKFIGHFILELLKK